MNLVDPVRSYNAVSMSRQCGAETKTLLVSGLGLTGVKTRGNAVHCGASVSEFVVQLLTYFACMGWSGHMVRLVRACMSCPGLYSCCMHTGVAHHVLCRMCLH